MYGSGQPYIFMVLASPTDVLGNRGSKGGELRDDKLECERVDSQAGQQAATESSGGCRRGELRTTTKPTRYQSGSFSLINVGSGFHCLRSFSFLFLFLRTTNCNVREWTVKQEQQAATKSSGGCGRGELRDEKLECESVHSSRSSRLPRKAVGAAGEVS
jgi:hypothetical protein